MFEKVLIANRGEIAIRIARTLREMGIASVAVYSELDRDALHVASADEAYLLGGPTAAESYLNVERILEVCRESGAQAVHPGYGFLAENARFAKACEDAGITFIGPPAGAIEAMGSKTRARELMKAAGVPIVPGTTEPVQTVEDARRIIADDIGFPVAVKAAGGGGGKGFRVALDESELEAAFEGAAREGEKFFSDATVYLERYLPDPRHVEVQVLADRHGNVIHLGERDCSVQRRHQKVIEESPAPAVDDEHARAHRPDRRRGRAGGRLRRRRDHRGPAAGRRVLLPGDEHARAGRALRDRDGHRHRHRPRGHPRRGGREADRRPGRRRVARPRDRVPHQRRGRIEEVRSRPGPDHQLQRARGAGVRVDSGVTSGSEVTPMYDPMVAKLIVWDVDREHATRRMVRALGEYEIGGLKTLIPFHVALLQTEQWANGETCRDLLEDKDWLKTLAFPKAEKPAGDDGEPEETVEQTYTVEVSGRKFDVRVIGPPFAGGGAAANGAAPAGARKPQRAERADSGGGAGADELVSPLQGNMWKVLVEAGQTVEEGQLVCIIEAMKMENEIAAHKAGVISELAVKEGDAVASGATIAVIKSDG